MSGATAAYVHEARTNLAQQNEVGPTRLRLFKRLVLRASQLFTHRLVTANAALASGLENVEAEVAQLRAELAAARNETRVRLEQGLVPQVVSIEVHVDEVLDGLANRLTQVTESLTTALEEERAARESRADELASAASSTVRRLERLELKAGHDRSELHRVRASLAQLSRAATSGAPVQLAAAPDSASTVLQDQLYVDFELRFRGSRDEVVARQRDAIRFVAGLAGSPYPLLDLGCGRGEWLELLAEQGITAYGVDSNEEMVAEVVARGLKAVVGDAIGHLEGLAPSSLQAISGFHLAEHMPLADLSRLLDAALLALRPGGLLLLETPNPTNLAVGAAAFYLDPTHLRPLHPDFLGFLLESRGFTGVETHFVHPLRPELLPDEDDPAGVVDPLVAAGSWALFGPQDYLVAARRHEVAG